MNTIVQKYGGTSMGTIDRIQNVARRVIAKKEEGNRMVVVVSAMGKKTDELVKIFIPTPKNWTRSALMKCWKWPASAQGSCTPEP